MSEKRLETSRRRFLSLPVLFGLGWLASKLPQEAAPERPVMLEVNGSTRIHGDLIIEGSVITAPVSYPPMQYNVRMFGAHIDANAISNGAPAALQVKA